MSKERIYAAAIKSKSGLMSIAPCHAECYTQVYPDPHFERAIQGFVTEDGRFVGRVEANKIAFEARQVGCNMEWLTSEDLTNRYPWENGLGRSIYDKERAF